MESLHIYDGKSYRRQSSHLPKANTTAKCKRCSVFREQAGNLELIFSPVNLMYDSNKLGFKVKIRIGFQGK